MLGQREQALELAASGIEMYPEFPLLQVTVAQLRDSLGMTREAVMAWKVAHDLNPFNPAVQQALARDYAALGEDALAERHARYARILATGGAVD